MAKNWGYLTLFLNPSRFIANKGVGFTQQWARNGGKLKWDDGQIQPGLPQSRQVKFGSTIVSNFPVKKIMAGHSDL